MEEPQRNRHLWRGDERYRVLFESIDEGFCVVEVLLDDQGAAVDFRFLETNPAFSKQTGLEDAVGKRIRELVPFHEDHWFEAFGRAAQTGEPQRFVDRARSLGGRWFDVCAFRVGEPDEHKVAILFSDVSARKRAEDAVRDSDERFRAFFEASTEVVYRMNADWTEMLELDGRKFIADTKTSRAAWPAEYLDAADQPTVMEAINEAIRTKSVFELEHRVRRIDGTLGWTLSRAVPIFNDDGTIREWFGTASDITARKQAEESLQVADRAKDQFLAVLGHELRNPLAALSTALELLERPGAPPQLIDTMLPMMRRQFGHLHRLVDDLLDVSRLSRGHAELQLTPLDLRTAIEAALEQASSLIEQQRHQLVVKLPREPVPVAGDLQRLTQVVGNLLTNAAKFSAPGGKITLVCRVERNEAVIRVTDTGFGIPSERLDTIFSMFNQVPEHRGRIGGGGLGVGLALARQLIELHGGAIHASSAGLDRGSQFEVRLPLQVAAVTADEPVPSPVATHEAQRSRRVLVVDDNVDAAESLRMVLELQGHDVRVAHTGLAALEALRRFDAEIVLLDLGLPGIDGIEIARRIRAMPQHGSTRIFALTGWGQLEDKQRTRSAGFDEHLTKPVDMGELLKLIDSELPDASPWQRSTRGDGAEHGNRPPR